MRKINGKLFLALLVGGIVLAVGVVVVHYFQYQRIGQALRWQALHAEEQGRPLEEATYLERYLEFNPRDNAARARLARLLAGDAYPAGSRARARAVQQMDRVLREGPDDPELRRLLVKVAIEIGDRKSAQEHLEKLLPRNQLKDWLLADKELRDRGKALPEHMARPDEQRGQLEGYWGQLLDSDEIKQPEQAIHCYRLAIRHAPDEQLNYVRLAYLLRRQTETSTLHRDRNRGEADRVINEMVQRNDSAFGSYLARWRYRRDFDLLQVRDLGDSGAESSKKVKLETAAEDVAAALKRKPESVDVLLAAADLERLRGRAAAEAPGQSSEQRRKGLEIHRNRAAEYLERGLALVAEKRGDPGENGPFHLLWHKGNLLLDDLDVRRAQHEEDGKPFTAAEALKKEISELIEQVRKSRVPAAADYMRGRLLVHDRQWAEAAQLFERSRTLMSGQPDLALQANLYLGKCYEKLEEHTQMFNAYERVHQRDPTNIAAIVGMAAARWSQGQLDAAKALYQVLRNDRSVPPRVWIDLARLEMQRQAQNDKPSWNEVDRILRLAEKHNPKNTLEVTLLQAEVLVRKDLPDQARRLIEAARDSKPDDPELWAALSDLELRRNRPDAARRALDEAREKFHDRKVALLLAEARWLAVVKKKDAVAPITALADKRARLSEDDQATLLGGLADVLVRHNELAAASRLWQTLSGLPGQRGNLRLRMLLFDQAMREGDEAGMNRALEAIRAVERNSGTYHRYGLALFDIWRARRCDDRERPALLARARRYLDAVLAQRPSWPPVFKARAEIAELNGHPELAAKELTSAVNNGDNSPATLRRLAILLNDLRKDREARDLLKRLKGRELAITEVRRLDAVVALRDGNIDRLLAQVNQLASEDTRDPRELVWIAQVLAEAGRHELAEKKFDQAIANAGTTPAPWVAKVQFLVNRRRKDEAVQLIARARGKINRQEVDLALARCYDLVGQPAEARKLYDRALQANPDHKETVQAVAAAHMNAGRGQLAEPLLRRLIAGGVPGTRGKDVELARQALATILAAGTDFQRFREALQLVGLELDEEGRLPARSADRDETTDMQRARARVLASQSQRQYRAEAIRLLEELERRGALRPDDQFVLAVLHDQDGQERKADQRLRNLVSTTQTPRYLAHYAMTLIARHRELDEAERKIVLLEKLERQNDVGPNGYGSVDLRSRLLEAKGKGKEALQLLEEHISREGAQPGEILLVLGSLSRQGQFQKAFERCQKTWDEGRCTPEALGAVSVGLLSVMKPTDAQVRVLEERLRAAIAKKPDSTVLLMHLATFYDKRGKYDEAAEQYREVLKREKNNVVALNNLAWLLALRSGKAREALDYINQAIRGMGRRADLLDTRAMVQLKLNNRNEALADLEEAVKDSPTPVRLYHLGLIQDEIGAETRARQALGRAREKGLEFAQLHPVEQDGARRLLAKYGVTLRR